MGPSLTSVAGHVRLGNDALGCDAYEQLAGGCVPSSEFLGTLWSHVSLYTIRRMPGENFVGSLAGGQLGGPRSDFVIVEWVDSGDSQWEWIAPLHVHHADDEAWYVLEGTLRFRFGDRILEAGPYAATFVPKGIPHAYGNAKPGQRARYLLVMTPKIHALVKALHEPGVTDYGAIFRAHDSELLS